MEQVSKIIPALDPELFGNITEEFNLELFTDRGHYPTAVGW